MTWIKTVPPERAEAHLRQCYDEVYSHYPREYVEPAPAIIKSDGSADSIVQAHSLIPEAMKHAMCAFGVLLNAELPLSRRQHEMIATVVSALNRCRH
jgi:hypothetical protein